MRALLLSAVFTAMVSLTAFGDPPGVVLVQFHSRNNALTVTRGPGKTETLDVPEPRVPKNYGKSAEKLLAVFAGLYAEGYELKNSTVSDAGSPSAFETVTYVFVKP